MGYASPRQLIIVNGRRYRWPQRPLVVVCLDGSPVDYLHAANNRGATPYLGRLMSQGKIRAAEAAMPTFTNPNNLSIVTGVAPAVHGISGNFFLNRATGQAIMMNDPALLWSETILAAFSRVGAKVAVVTAKDKLRQMLGTGLNGSCISAEQEGQPVYSAALSEYVLQRGVELMRSERPDLLYLSTSDYIQHLYPAGAPEANDFYAVIDGELEKLDRQRIRLVVTADHGMSSKTDENGRPCAIFLQALLDDWYGAGAATVILPITDPYIRHHGSLGSFATIYVSQSADMAEIIRRVGAISGIQLALEQREACLRFELPPDRTGDIVVCAERHIVFGTRPNEHDLGAISRPLRSHGGLAERIVPIIFNRTINRKCQFRRLRNYDAFWLGLNAMDDN